MPKRKKSKKRNLINSSVPQNQTSVEKRPPIVRYATQDSIRLQRERHTLSREEDFLNILCIDNIPGQETANTINLIAEKIINEWNHDWEYIKTEKPTLYAYTPEHNIKALYNDFSYQKMGIIRLYKGYYKDKGKIKNGLFLQDGHHRTLTLTCLLLEKKIKWHPIPYWLWAPANT